jgi:hypothetical protein
MIRFTKCPRTCSIKNVTIEEEPEEKEEKEDCPELQEDDKDDDEEGETLDYVAEHPGAFSEAEHIPLAEHQEFDHKIKLTDETPVAFKPYPLTKEECEHLKGWLEGSIKKGQYQPSKLPWAVLIFFKHEPQSDGTMKLRLLVDYRALNDKTIKDKYPLPNI